MTTVEFDDGRAQEYRPREERVKTAILLTPARTPLVIQTSFGEQQMHGPFYVVADGNSSYGAAQDEFERTHRNVGPNEWVKVEPVLAYQVDERSTVTTTIGDRTETTVVAQPGDWIVKQHTGELMVIHSGEFEARYADDPG